MIPGLCLLRGFMMNDTGKLNVYYELFACEQAYDADKAWTELQTPKPHLAANRIKATGKVCIGTVQETFTISARTFRYMTGMMLEER